MFPHLLKRLKHTPPSRPQYSPHEHNSVQYSKKGEYQLTAPIDTSTPLHGKEITRIQSIVGALYYTRAIDNTILTALNDIAAMQAKPTEKTRERCEQLLDYIATYPNIKLRFHASDMELHVDSDAA